MAKRGQLVVKVSERSVWGVNCSSHSAYTDAEIVRACSVTREGQLRAYQTLTRVDGQVAWFDHPHQVTHEPRSVRFLFLGEDADHAGAERAVFALGLDNQPTDLDGIRTLLRPFVVDHSKETAKPVTIGAQ